MVSVILPTYNESIGYIRKSVESIQAQTYRDLEILVIVDNPTRRDLIKELQAIKKTDNRINILVNDKNIGLTASLNRGISCANGEYIARMDADDIAMPERFEKQLRFLQHNNYDIVGSDIANIDENDKVIVPRIVYPRRDREIKAMLRYNSAMPHPTWFGKREIFDELHYIDYLACEDYEFLVRAALRGKRMGNVGEVLLRYRINNNGVSANKKAVQKTSLAYLRRLYRSKQEGEYGQYMQYLNSAAGIKCQKRMHGYYEIVNMTKGEGGRLMKIIRIIPRMHYMLNSAAFGNIYSTLRTRIIRKKTIK